jgi:hypothetical protein
MMTSDELVMVTTDSLANIQKRLEDQTQYSIDLNRLLWAVAHGCDLPESAKGTHAYTIAKRAKDRQRQLFDAGFAAARAMGDNALHYHGEQADRIYEKAAAAVFQGSK